MERWIKERCIQISAEKNWKPYFCKYRHSVILLEDFIHYKSHSFIGTVNEAENLVEIAADGYNCAAQRYKVLLCFQPNLGFESINADELMNSIINLKAQHLVRLVSRPPVLTRFCKSGSKLTLKVYLIRFCILNMIFHKFSSSSSVSFHVIFLRGWVWWLR